MCVPSAPDLCKAAASLHLSPPLAGGVLKDMFELPASPIYLDCASRSPLPISVRAVGEASVRRKSAPWEIGDTDAVAKRVRLKAARLLGCGDPASIALCPSTSFAFSAAAGALAASIPAEGDVVVLEDEMSSSVLAMQHLCASTGATLRVVPRPPDGDWTAAILRCAGGWSWDALAVLSVPNAHWIDGSIVDLAKICARVAEVREARSTDAPHVLVDATQSLGALPIDVEALGVDLCAASVHKWLLGPYGLSVAYVSPRLHDAAPPLVHDDHGRTGASATTSPPFRTIPIAGGRLAPYPETFQRGARRFDGGGRPNPIILPMVDAALDVVLGLGVRAIAAGLDALTAPAKRRLRATTGVSLPAATAPGFFGCRFRVTAQAERARDYLAENGVRATARFGALRVSAHLYNTPADLERLCDDLASFLRKTGA